MLVCVEMARTRGSIILSILSACRREMQKISNQEGPFVLRSWRSALSIVSESPLYRGLQQNPRSTLIDHRTMRHESSGKPVGQLHKPPRRRRVRGPEFGLASAPSRHRLLASTIRRSFDSGEWVCGRLPQKLDSYANWGKCARRSNWKWRGYS